MEFFLCNAFRMFFLSFDEGKITLVLSLCDFSRWSKWQNQIDFYSRRRNRIL